MQNIKNAENPPNSQKKKIENECAKCKFNRKGEICRKDPCEKMREYLTEKKRADPPNIMLKIENDIARYTNERLASPSDVEGDT